MLEMLQKLPKNVGPMDRNIRLGAAGVLILLGLITNNIILDILGLIVVATAVIGFCPAYLLFKFNTLKKD